MTPLVGKRARFVEEYLIDLNATQAAVRSGYSPHSAGVEGCRLLRNANVRAHVDMAMAERSKRTGVNADRILDELGKIAFVNPADALDLNEAMILPEASADDTAAIQYIKCKRSSFGNNGESVEREVKFHDKLKALDMAGRHIGMWSDKRGSGGGDENELNTGVVLLPPVLPEPVPPENVLSDFDDGDALE